jgi:hypothetical protein
MRPALLAKAGLATPERRNGADIIDRIGGVSRRETKPNEAKRCRS